MTELKWGLGVEKEFPILIGPYKLSVYENIIQLFVNQFDLTFSFCSDDIKTKIRNRSKKSKISSNYKGVRICSLD